MKLIGLHLERKPLRIGIPIEDITGVKIYDPNPNSFNATIYVKTDENSAAWIRKLLGMSRSEESQGFYSPRSKCKFQFDVEPSSLFHIRIFWSVKQ